MNKILRHLQDILHNEIPLTIHMGIQVNAYRDGELVLQAPLEPNTNHKCTAFGGSLYSLAVLTGWSRVWLLLHENQIDAHIVIQESHMSYQNPVESYFVARTRMPTPGVVTRFLRLFQRRGLARVQLEVAVEDANGQPAASFVGSYVIHRQ